MAVTETRVDALELERVMPKVKKVFEQDDLFYSSIKKRNVVIVSYRSMKVPLELRPGGRFQYFNADGGDLGRGDGPTWDNASVTPVFLSENIEYTKLTEWSTNNDKKAVVNAVRRMIAGALDELRRQIDSQLVSGDGTGVVGTIDAVATTGGVDTYTLDNEYGARLVRHGQIVQVYDATLATLRGKGAITEWDVDAGTIDVTPAVAGAVATDVLVVDGLSNPASLPALHGVKYHHSNASTGTWQGFSRATTPEIRSNRVNAGSSALSMSLPRLAINKMGNRVGIKNNFKVNAWLHPAQKQAFEDVGQAMMSIQKQPKSESLNFYFDKMSFAGAPDKPHFSWSKKRIDFIDEDVWGRAEILPIGFYRTDGRNIFEIRGASGGVATADIFYMVNGFQTFLTNPGATAYIDNLAIPEGY